MVSAANYQSVYRNVQIGTSGKEKLIGMLFNGAIVVLQRARELMKANDHVAKGEAIFKAQDIVMELSCCIDEDQGNLSANLRRLYAYAYRRLSEANFRQDPMILDEVIRLLSGLRDAWTIAANRAAVARDADPGSRLV